MAGGAVAGCVGSKPPEVQKPKERIYAFFAAPFDRNEHITAFIGMILCRGEFYISNQVSRDGKQRHFRLEEAGLHRDLQENGGSGGKVFHEILVF